MVYCPNCGAQTSNEQARFCTQCGSRLYNKYASPSPVSTKAKNVSALQSITFVLMIIHCVFATFLIIPLAWHIPMTICYFKKIIRGEPISIGFKVCSLLFISIVVGCLMFADTMTQNT